MSKKILFSLDRGLPGDTKYGASLSLTINDEYVISGQLLDQNGDPLGEEQTLDLPLESMVVDGSYDSENKALILTLDNGNTISIPIADLINGLQAEITPENKLSADLVDDSSTENKFVTQEEKEEIAKSAELNLENGIGDFSLRQKEGDTSTGESDDRKNYAYGRSDAAFGHKNKTYQRDAFAFGGGNKVGLTENEFLELYPSGVDGSGKNYSDSYSFSIAIGENNEVTSRSGSALGVRNEVSGQGSVALGGENNVTGSYSLAAGSRNHLSSSYSIGLGYNNTLRGASAKALGNSNLIDSSAAYSIVVGNGLLINRSLQTALGNYNKPVDANTLLVLGNGTAENARSNAFEVTKTGVARAYGTPSGNNDLTPKSYVDSGLSTKINTSTIDASFFNSLY